MKKIGFYITILFFLFNSISIVLAKERVLVIETKRIINIRSLDTFFKDEVQHCANWDLTKQEIELFFNQLALPIEDLPMSRVPLSCDVKGKVRLNNQLWTFRINAGGYGELHNGPQSLFFTCGDFADAKPECEKFFIRVPENYEDDVDNGYIIPPLFDK